MALRGLPSAVATPLTPAVSQRGIHLKAHVAHVDSDTVPAQPQKSVWTSLLPAAPPQQGPSAPGSAQPWRLVSSDSSDEEPFSLIACAWEMLLRGAENPAEFSRNDRSYRSRTRYSQHRAARPLCSPEERELHRRAMYKHRKGRTNDAIKMLRTGMEQYPTNSFFATSIGSIYSKKKKYQKAEEYLQHALRVNPDNSVVLNALGGVRAKQGDADQARQLYQQAVEARPAELYLCHACKGGPCKNVY